MVAAVEENVDCGSRDWSVANDARGEGGGMVVGGGGGAATTAVKLGLTCRQGYLSRAACCRGRFLGAGGGLGNVQPAGTRRQP